MFAHARSKECIPDRVMQKTWKIHAISLLSIQYYKKEHGSETHTDNRRLAPTVAFTVLAQLGGPQANEMEMDPPYSPIMVNFDFDLELNDVCDPERKYLFQC